MTNKDKDEMILKKTQQMPYLMSSDALEVILSLTYLLIVRTDLTDVTLVSDDTY